MNEIALETVTVHLRRLHDDKVQLSFGTLLQETKTLDFSPGSTISIDIPSVLVRKTDAGTRTMVLD